MIEMLHGDAGGPGCISDEARARLRLTPYDRDVSVSAPRVFDFGWWRGLFDLPKFKAAYFARFRQLIANELGVANLHALFDVLAAQLGTEAPARNFARWTADPPIGGSHAGEKKVIKDWLTLRVQWIEGCLALPDPEACR